MGDEAVKVLRDAGLTAQADALNARLNGREAAEEAVRLLREGGRHRDANAAARTLGVPLTMREVMSEVPTGAELLRRRLVGEWGDASQSGEGSPEDTRERQMRRILGINDNSEEGAR